MGIRDTTIPVAIFCRNVDTEPGKPGTQNEFFIQLVPNIELVVLD